MKAIEFNWDNNKAKINLAKHKISFEEAQSVFDDDNARLIFDPDHSENEDRFILTWAKLLFEGSSCSPLL